MKKVAIIQSNYIPWKGYFDLVCSVDFFIFYDDVQYTKNDWRNRNRIKSIRGAEWLTVPCGPNERRLICQVNLSDASWQRKHWAKLACEYGNAPHFHRYRDFFEDFYLNTSWSNLSEMNHYLIKMITREFLGNDQVIFEDSRHFNLKGRKGDRVLDLLSQVGATEYLTGPSAKNYLDERIFHDRDIRLRYANYDGYKEYNQLHPPFVHNVSILDLLFCEGPDALNYMKFPYEGL